jgi:hypothetical protein
LFLFQPFKNGRECTAWLKIAMAVKKVVDTPAPCCSIDYIINILKHNETIATSGFSAVAAGFNPSRAMTPGFKEINEVL